MAPEVIRMKEADSFTFKSDIYAYGIVLFEIFAQQLPYRKTADGDSSGSFEKRPVRAPLSLSLPIEMSAPATTH